jgi:hypothetical protein
LLEALSPGDDGDHAGDCCQSHGCAQQRR